MKPLVLDGRLVAKKIEEKLKEKVYYFKEKSGKNPTLATVVVGDDFASHTYVKMKGNACERIGITFIKIKLENDVNTNEVIEVIERLNNDDNIDGILIQHPLPKHIDERQCFDKINVDKDVDGVTSCGFGAMAMGEQTYKSATALGIMTLLDFYNIEVEGKNVVVLGRSAILGKPISMMMLNRNATVTIAHSKTLHLDKIVKNADIVVAGVGKPNFVKKEWLKKSVVIIDAGYNEGNVGDVDLKNAISVCGAYTPVPGGVGPMTIVSLLSQTVEAFEKKILHN